MFSKALDNEILDHEEQALFREAFCSGNLPGLFMSRAFDEGRSEEEKIRDVEEAFEQMGQLLNRDAASSEISRKKPVSIVENPGIDTDFGSLHGSTLEVLNTLDKISQEFADISQKVDMLMAILSHAAETAQALTENLLQEKADSEPQAETIPSGSLEQRIQAISEALPSGSEIRIRPVFRFSEPEEK